MRARTGRGYPAPGGNVGNGETIADNEARCALREVGIQDSVEAAGLVDVTVDAVLDLLRRIAF